MVESENLREAIDAELATSEQLSEQYVSPPPPDVRVVRRIAKMTLPWELLDHDAVKTVRRLTGLGYRAYLVGGCIRDILLDRKPKDFDVVTSARPMEVKRAFRNCRLIGRRFRLAHLHYRYGKIIEVATFRRTATEEDDISDKHAAENLFGTPPDDAIRRDFTINALFYDVSNRQIMDYVGGLEDIEARVLRTIGDPNRRFVEDPVRIVRAVKFATQLDLTIEAAAWAAMKEHAHLLGECASARLVEEFFKIFRSGYAAACFHRLEEIGALQVLLPTLSKRAAKRGPEVWDLMAQADERVRQGRPVSEAVMLAAMLYPHCKDVLLGRGDVSKRLEEQLIPLVAPVRFTKRHLARVRHMMIAQRRLLPGPVVRRARRILDRDYAPDAIELLELIADGEEEIAIAKEWRRLHLRHKKEVGHQESPTGRRSPGRRRAPRRKKTPDDS